MDERVTLEELDIPEALDGPGGRAFREMVDVRNAIESLTIGSDEFAPTAEELLPIWRNAVDEPKRLLVARVDGRVASRAVLELPPETGSRTAYVSVEVLPEVREAGIGTAMLTMLEGWAIDAGRSILESFVIHGPGRDGPVLTPPTGFGAVPADDDAVRFALGRGYRLEQVARMSRLVLADARAIVRNALEEAARRSRGYSIETCAGVPPHSWLDDLALLQRRMSTDAPAAGLEIDEEDWDAERVLRMARDREEGGGRHSRRSRARRPRAASSRSVSCSCPPNGSGRSFRIRRSCSPSTVGIVSACS